MRSCRPATSRGRRSFTSPIEPDGRAATADLPIAELGLEPGAVIAYRFDIGDEWRVLLTLRERAEADPGTYHVSSSASGAHRPGTENRRTDTYREVMPRISSFYGIAIYMHWNEGHHARPHFHARYAGQAATVDLDGNLIAGSLPRRALGLVAEWAQQHRNELEANWERARRAEALEPVDPLA